MSLASRASKENFRLLDLSSDEDSEDLQLEIIPSRKKKITRRERNRGTANQTPEPNIATEVQCALRWAVRGTLLLWLIMLTWICAALYDQVSSMSLEVKRVSTSSDGVGDALQFCHNAAKELRYNASLLNTRLTQLENDHRELVKRVEKAAMDLAVVSDQLSAAPKLADTPKRLAELQRTVADFGSQINGFDGTIESAKKQALTAVTGVEEVRTLLHQLEERTNDTIANITTNTKQDEELKTTIITLNNTLATKVEALRTRIEEISKPVSTPAPTPVTAARAPAAPTTTAAPVPVATSTTTMPPGPAKPSVLQ